MRSFFVFVFAFLLLIPGGVIAADCGRLTAPMCLITDGCEWVERGGEEFCAPSEDEEEAASGSETGGELDSGDGTSVDVERGDIIDRSGSTSGGSSKTGASSLGREGEASASCAGELAAYMNSVIDGRNSRGLTNIKVLSPAFAFVGEFNLFKQMEAAGARFGELDGIAGNTYTAYGKTAYEWYSSVWKDSVAGYGPVFFTEWGDFDHDVFRMKEEHRRGASDSTISQINYFNALGANGDAAFAYAVLSQGEFSDITGGGVKAGINTATSLNPSLVSQSASWGAKSVVGIEFDTDESDAVAFSNQALSLGLVPIIRICAGSSCVFEDVEVYIEYLTRLNAGVAGPVYIIAGPNEPSLEPWLCGVDLASTLCNYTKDVGRRISDPEYHSLRPYPSCPWDPGIYETDYYMCGQDLVTRERFNFAANGVPEGFTVKECSQTSRGLECVYSVDKYLDVEIDLTDTQLPILGLTEEPYVTNRYESDGELTEATKMNEYVSWYLNGALFQTSCR
jgi:hypothetical protein